MTWLRKKAELVEVIVNHPEKTTSGVCAQCMAADGQPAANYTLPLHPHCACGTQTVEKETQPGKVLDETFEGMQPAEFILEEPDQGGVEEINL